MSDRAGRRRERAQRRQQRLAVMGDRRHLVAIEQPWQHALGDLAVRQHVRDAARHAQIVFQHDELAAFQPDEIGAGDRYVNVAMDVDAAHFATKVFAAVDQLARHDAFVEDPALVIDVFEKQVDRGEALGQPALEHAPFGRGDDARQQVVGKDPLRSLRIAVNREGDALREKGLFRFGLMLAQLGRPTLPADPRTAPDNADAARPPDRTSRRTRRRGDSWKTVRPLVGALLEGALVAMESRRGSKRRSTDVRRRRRPVAERKLPNDFRDFRPKSTEWLGRRSATISSDAVVTTDKNV